MGFSRRTIEVLVAIGILVVGLTIIINSVHLGIGWSNNSPEPGYFPIRVGGILTIASAGIAIQAFLNRSPPAMEPFVSWDRFRRVLAVFIPTAIYCALAAWLGIYVPSVLLIAAFMIASRKFGWFRILAVSVGSMVAVFWLFEIEFLVPLPKGPLEALLGY